MTRSEIARLEYLSRLPRLLMSDAAYSELWVLSKKLSSIVKEL